MTASPCRVLVVDDNRDAADSQAVLLRLDGHDVRVAYDAEEALGIAGELDPEVALIDLALPRKDGYELCAELRKLCPQCKMVAVSGYGDQEHVERSRRAGFRHHLLKPVEPRHVAGIVEEECSEVPSCE
jgi:CheY-like chemotaxis protein